MKLGTTDRVLAVQSCLLIGYVTYTAERSFSVTPAGATYALTRTYTTRAHATRALQNIYTRAMRNAHCRRCAVHYAFAALRNAR